jgi:NADPH:quinone reductase-like Zn-dependent oxidoreductase
MMKAIFRNSYGSADALELREIDKPMPKDDELLLKVHAASVNPLDWHILRGEPFLVRLMGFGLLKPKHQILGADMAGWVEAIGKNVTQFKVGDEVFGSGMGGFAEYARIRENQTVPKPATITFEQAAAVPVAGLTALQALRKHGQIQDGQHVLINGASGGVGTFAVQIAKALGAKVTGVCSGKNVEMVRSIGAHHVIDYTQEDFWLSGKEYDLIIDNAAFYSIRKPLQALKATGIYVGVGGPSSTASFLQSLIVNPIAAKIKGRKVVSFIADLNQADLFFMKELLEDGKVVPFIERKYSLAETPQAIRYVEGGHTRGKVVISVCSESAARKPAT